MMWKGSIRPQAKMVIAFWKFHPTMGDYDWLMMIVMMMIVVMMLVMVMMTMAMMMMTTTVRVLQCPSGDIFYQNMNVNSR